MKDFKALRVLDGNRPSVSKLPDGRITFRPSELGKCIRGLVACLQGHKPADFTFEQKRTMRQGEIHEKHIAHDLELEIGGKVQRQIRLTLPIADGQYSIDGTCDGVWFLDGDEINDSLFEIEKSGPWHDPDIVHYHTRYCDVDLAPTVAGVEIKASDETMFDEMHRNGPIDAYKVQISVYWYMIEHTLGVKLTGVWFCVGQRNNGDRSYRFITEPYYSLEWIEDRCRKIVYYSLVEMHCANSVDCDKEDAYGCKWWAIHKRDEGNYEEFPKAAKHKKMMFQPDLAGLFMEYHKESEAAEVHTKRANLKRKELEDALNIRGLERAATMGARMYWGAREWVDIEALQADHPDVAGANRKEVLDVDKLRENHPALVARYTKKGNRFMTIKTNDEEIAKLKARMAAGEELPKPNRATSEMLSESGKKSLIAELGL